MRKILTVFLVWILLLNIVNKVSFRFLSDYTSYELPKNQSVHNRFWVVPWLNFDGRHYLQITTQGYNAAQKKFNIRVFLPFYPLIVRVVSLNLFLNPIIVGLLVSLSAFLASIFVFNKLLIQEKLSVDTRMKTLFLVFLFPASFYFATFYAESIFFFLTLLSFYFLNKKNFLAASVSVAFATATKLFGLALLPAIIWESYQYYKVKKRWPLSILLSPLGLIFYSIYTYITTGNGALMFFGHKDWGREVGFLSPLVSFSEGFMKVLYGSSVSKANIFAYSIEVLEFFSAIFLVTVLFYGFSKMKRSYWLYMFFSALMMFFSGVLISMPRHLILLFPMYILLATRLPAKVYYVVSVCFLILFLYLSALFLRGYWVA